MQILLEGGTFDNGVPWHDGAWYVLDIDAEDRTRAAPDSQAVETVQAAAGDGGYVGTVGGKQGNSLLLYAAPGFSQGKRQVWGEVVVFGAAVSVPRGVGRP